MYNIQTKLSVVYQFKYFQNDNGDVCTLINGINEVYYMKDRHSGDLDAVYLNIEKWGTYQTQIAPNRATGFDIGHVINLL